MTFRVVKAFQPDFIIAHHILRGGSFTQPWTRCIARKHSDCEISNAEISPGDIVFRPITNARNRMCRVLASEVDRLTGFHLWYLELNDIAKSKSILVDDRDAWFDPFKRGLSPVESIDEEYPDLINRS